MPQTNVIPNQIFIGLPWKNIRAKYVRVADILSRSYPLSFVIVGREETQDAEELLDIIKRNIDSSSYAVFDATQNNPNVSLEYGYAEAQGIRKALYLCSRRTSGNKEHSIISDLAGKRRNHWTTEKSLTSLMKRLAEGHPYTKRFRQFLASESGAMSKGAKRRARILALRIIHRLDGKIEDRREDVVQDLQVDVNRYKESEINSMIRKLHRSGIIVCGQGRYSNLAIN
jgi:hypothetical protein